MSKKPEQMPFDLGHSTQYAPEDFFVSACNAEAHAWVGKWPDWPAPLLVVHGPAACGKTHLGSLWRARAKASAVTAIQNLRDLRGAVFVDDADKIFIGDREAEEVLFHAVNRAREEGGHLLLTASAPPRGWSFVLPDLKSRILAAPASALAAPDDRLISVALSKMFSDRQIFVPQEVIAFILPRMERSLAAARSLAEAVDRKALAEKRAVTVPLVRELMQGMAGTPGA